MTSHGRDGCDIHCSIFITTQPLQPNALFDIEQIESEDLNGLNTSENEYRQLSKWHHIPTAVQKGAGLVLTFQHLQKVEGGLLKITDSLPRWPVLSCLGTDVPH